MEEFSKCVYCHNECDLSAPKCGKGERMALEVENGTWKGPSETEGRKDGRHSHDESKSKKHGKHNENDERGEHHKLDEQGEHCEQHEQSEHHKHGEHGEHGEHHEHGKRGGHRHGHHQEEETQEVQV